MTEVLGHDIDGRPLRVGDEVVLVVGPGPISRSRGFYKGVKLTITGSKYCRITLETNSGKFTHAEGSMLRKLHKDHRPADESFTEMMGRLTGEKVCTQTSQ